MKKQWLIMGNEEKFMREIFSINEQELKQVKNFMEKDFTDLSDFLKKIVESDFLSYRQKILAAYILGNTVGAQIANNLMSHMEDRRENVAY